MCRCPAYFELGQILWDFSKLQMKFHIDNREITLQGFTINSLATINFRLLLKKIIMHSWSDHSLEVCLNLNLSQLKLFASKLDSFPTLQTVVNNFMHYPSNYPPQINISQLPFWACIKINFTWNTSKEYFKVWVNVILEKKMK